MLTRDANRASERTLAGTRALGLNVVEATCPLVHVAHRAVAALVRDADGGAPAGLKAVLSSAAGRGTGV